MRNRPGQKVQTAESARASDQQQADPDDVRVKPARTSSRWGCRLAIRWAIADDSRMPMVAGISMSPVWMAV